MGRRFHLCHIIPHPRLHIFHGYKEVIDSIGWGLNQLGHAVTYEVNKFSPDATNIVFGAQMLDPAILRGLPSDTIIYHLEQIAVLDPDQIRESIRYCAEHFEIWDYSEFNLPTWKAIHGQCRLSHVPIGYAPILSRIGKPPIQDIEVLFYGGAGGTRLQIFADLCQKLVKTVFAHGLYGESRDNLIARSRIVLNINQYPDSHIFEIARVSYLLANRKAVISDYSASSKIESDIREAILFKPNEQIVDECLRILEHPDQIAELENKGFESISRRDIRNILAPALIGD